VLILFSTTGIFQRQQQERLFESIKEAIAYSVKVRIPIPHDDDDEDQITQIVQQLRDNQINIRFIRDPLPYHLSTVIVDGTFSLAFESENIDEHESAKEEDDSANTIKTTLGVYSTMNQWR